MMKPIVLSSRSLDKAEIGLLDEVHFSQEDIERIQDWARASGITHSEAIRLLVDLGMIKAVKRGKHELPNPRNQLVK